MFTDVSQLEKVLFSENRSETIAKLFPENSKYNLFLNALTARHEMVSATDEKLFKQAQTSFNDLKNKLKNDYHYEEFAILESQSFLDEYTEFMALNPESQSVDRERIFYNICKAVIPNYDHERVSACVPKVDVKTVTDEKAAANFDIPLHTLPSYLHDELTFVEYVLRMDKDIVFKTAPPHVLSSLVPIEEAFSYDWKVQLAPSAVDSVIKLVLLGKVDLYARENYTLMSWVMNNISSTHPLVLPLLIVDLHIHYVYYNTPIAYEDAEKTGDGVHSSEPDYNTVYFGSRPCHNSLTYEQLVVLGELYEFIWMSKTYLLCLIQHAFLTNNIDYTQTLPSPYNPLIDLSSVDTTKSLSVFSDADVSLLHPRLVEGIRAYQQAISLAKSAEAKQKKYVSDFLKGTIGSNPCHKLRYLNAHAEVANEASRSTTYIAAEVHTSMICPIDLAFFPDYSAQPEGATINLRPITNFPSWSEKYSLPHLNLGKHGSQKLTPSKKSKDVLYHLSCSTVPPALHVDALNSSVVIYLLTSLLTFAYDNHVLLYPILVELLNDTHFNSQWLKDKTFSPADLKVFSGLVESVPVSINTKDKEKEQRDRDKARIEAEADLTDLNRLLARVYSFSHITVPNTELPCSDANTLFQSLVLQFYAHVFSHTSEYSAIDKRFLAYIRDDQVNELLLSSLLVKTGGVVVVEECASNSNVVTRNNMTAKDLALIDTLVKKMYDDAKAKANLTLGKTFSTPYDTFKTSLLRSVSERACQMTSHACLDTSSSSASKINWSSSHLNRSYYDMTDSHGDKAEEDMELVLDVRNVDRLTIKYFRVDTLGVLINNVKNANGKMNSIDESLDLEGVEPHLQREVVLSDLVSVGWEGITNKPIHHHPYNTLQLHLKLNTTSAAPSEGLFSGRGCWVVDVSADGGQSVRAVLHRGKYSLVSRTRGRGVACVVVDEAGQIVRDARIIIGSHTYGKGTLTNGAKDSVTAAETAETDVLTASEDDAQALTEAVQESVQESESAPSTPSGRVQLVPTDVIVLPFSTHHQQQVIITNSIGSFASLARIDTHKPSFDLRCATTIVSEATLPGQATSNSSKPASTSTTTSTTVAGVETGVKLPRPHPVELIIRPTLTLDGAAVELNSVVIVSSMLTITVDTADGVQLTDSVSNIIPLTNSTSADPAHLIINSLGVKVLAADKEIIHPFSLPSNATNIQICISATLMPRVAHASPVECSYYYDHSINDVAILNMTCAMFNLIKYRAQPALKDDSKKDKDDKKTQKPVEPSVEDCLPSYSCLEGEPVYMCVVRDKTGSPLPHTRVVVKLRHTLLDSPMYAPATLTYAHSRHHISRPDYYNCVYVLTTDAQGNLYLGPLEYVSAVSVGMYLQGDSFSDNALFRLSNHYYTSWALTDDVEYGPSLPRTVNIEIKADAEDDEVNFSMPLPTTTYNNTLDVNSRVVLVKQHVLTGRQASDSSSALPGRVGVAICSDHINVTHNTLSLVGLESDRTYTLYIQTQKQMTVISINTFATTIHSANAASLSAMTANALFDSFDCAHQITQLLKVSPNAQDCAKYLGERLKNTSSTNFGLINLPSYFTSSVYRQPQVRLSILDVVVTHNRGVFFLTDVYIFHTHSHHITNDSITINTNNASSHSRVHVFATVFDSLSKSVAELAHQSPYSITYDVDANPQASACEYINNCRNSTEFEYVLLRKRYLQEHGSPSGIMLSKPSLLLHQKKTQDTQWDEDIKSEARVTGTKRQVANKYSKKKREMAHFDDDDECMAYASCDMVMDSMPRSGFGGAMKKSAMRSRARVAHSSAHSSTADPVRSKWDSIIANCPSDFLSGYNYSVHGVRALRLLNLEPDAEGRVTIARSLLNEHHYNLVVMTVDKYTSTAMNITLTPDSHLEPPQGSTVGVGGINYPILPILNSNSHPTSSETDAGADGIEGENSLLNYSSADIESSYVGVDKDAGDKEHSLHDTSLTETSIDFETANVHVHSSSEPHNVELHVVDVVGPESSCTLTPNSEYITINNVEHLFNAIVTINNSSAASSHQHNPFIANLPKYKTAFSWLFSLPTLSTKEKISLHSQYSCHEVNLFLRQHDPAFFDLHVRKMLMFLVNKDVIDWYLLSTPISQAYVESEDIQWLTQYQLHQRQAVSTLKAMYAADPSLAGFNVIERVLIMSISDKTRLRSYASYLQHEFNHTVSEGMRMKAVEALVRSRVLKSGDGDLDGDSDQDSDSESDSDGEELVEEMNDEFPSVVPESFEMKDREIAPQMQMMYASCPAPPVAMAAPMSMMATEKSMKPMAMRSMKMSAMAPGIANARIGGASLSVGGLGVARKEQRNTTDSFDSLVSSVEEAIEAPKALFKNVDDTAEYEEGKWFDTNAYKTYSLDAEVRVQPDNRPAKNLVRELDVWGELALYLANLESDSSNTIGGGVGVGVGRHVKFTTASLTSFINTNITEAMLLLSFIDLPLSPSLSDNTLTTNSNSAAGNTLMTHSHSVMLVTKRVSSVDCVVDNNITAKTTYCDLEKIVAANQLKRNNRNADGNLGGSKFVNKNNLSDETAYLCRVVLSNTNEYDVKTTVFVTLPEGAVGLVYSERDENIYSRPKGVHVDGNVMTLNHFNSSKSVSLTITAYNNFIVQYAFYLPKQTVLPSAPVMVTSSKIKSPFSLAKFGKDKKDKEKASLNGKDMKTGESITRIPFRHYGVQVAVADEDKGDIVVAYANTNTLIVTNANTTTKNTDINTILRLGDVAGILTYIHSFRHTLSLSHTISPKALAATITRANLFPANLREVTLSGGKIKVDCEHKRLVFAAIVCHLLMHYSHSSEYHEVLESFLLLAGRFINDQGKNSSSTTKHLLDDELITKLFGVTNVLAVAPSPTSPLPPIISIRQVIDNALTVLVKASPKSNNVGLYYKNATKFTLKKEKIEKHKMELVNIVIDSFSHHLVNLQHTEYLPLVSARFHAINNSSTGSASPSDLLGKYNPIINKQLRAQYVKILQYCVFRCTSISQLPAHILLTLTYLMIVTERLSDAVVLFSVLSSQHYSRLHSKLANVTVDSKTSTFSLSDIGDDHALQYAYMYCYLDLATQGKLHQAISNNGKLNTSEDSVSYLDYASMLSRTLLLSQMFTKTNGVSFGLKWDMLFKQVYDCVCEVASDHFQDTEVSDSSDPSDSLPDAKTGAGSATEDHFLSQVSTSAHAKAHSALSDDEPVLSLAIVNEAIELSVTHTHAVDNGIITITGHMHDSELTLGANPFNLDAGGRFHSLKPNFTLSLSVTPPIDGTVTVIPEPTILHTSLSHVHVEELKKIVSEAIYVFNSSDSVTITLQPPSFACTHTIHLTALITGTSIQTSTSLFTNKLRPAIISQYGQLRITALAKHFNLPNIKPSVLLPVGGVYVKVYGRMIGGSVEFYKDGYTDISGRFDFATLSGKKLDRVEKFAIIIVHPTLGSCVVQSDPPPR